MKKIITLLLVLFFAENVMAADVGNVPAIPALQRLQAGNERFAKMEPKHPNTSKDRLEQLAKFQHPFAVIVSCSDSRVPPELIFDQGLGDLFVIRNAGNIIDEHVLGSVEYAVEHLGVNLVIVMGHESCGAVGAAMKDEPATPAIESIKKAIRPSICQCKKEDRYTYQDVIKTNAKLVADTIANDKSLSESIKKRGIKIVPAYYNLSNGKVEFSQ